MALHEKSCCHYTRKVILVEKETDCQGERFRLHDLCQSPCDLCANAAERGFAPMMAQEPSIAMRNEPRTASMTVRRQILHLLGQYECTARDISRIMGIREKEVYEHLPHLEKTLGNSADLISEPARCLNCDFVFKKRRRFTTPGRCPVCRSESISPPVYHVRYRKGKRAEHTETEED